MGAYDHGSISAIAERRKTRRIQLGPVAVGGGAPISVQSMTTTQTTDVQGTLAQIRALAEQGADVVPLAALEAGIHCIRLNPGNIGSARRVREVVKAARERKVPIRIGVNAGSLEEDIVAKHGWPTAEGMVESAERHIRLLEDEGYREIKVSLKAHDIGMTVAANRLFSQRFDYPLHLGITEAGTLMTGTIKSAAGLAILLAGGIGDTLRVSLAADPVEEVKVARSLLKSLGLKFGGATLTACPTCGRCSVAMIPIAERVEQRLSRLKGEVNVAVMGCEVNGPGEAAAADVGVAYGHGGVG